MRLIAFTYPEDNAAEKTVLNQILPFVDGLHLRKESSVSRQYWKELLEGIPSDQLSKVWIHDHYDLAGSLGLGGIHLTRDFQSRYTCGLIKQIEKWRRSGVKLSATCRKAAELNSLAAWADRVFIAPVFNSISKPGHLSKWNLDQWQVPEEINSEIIALGGVDAAHIPLLTQKGFDGLAVLGALWSAPDQVEKITQLKTTCKEAALTY